MIVGSHSSVKEALTCFVFIYSVGTLQLFSLFFEREEPQTVSKATHIECVKMVTFHFGFFFFFLDIKFASHCLCAFNNENPLDWTRGS